MEGPELVNLRENEEGKVTKVHAFPGHNIVIGALGCLPLFGSDGMDSDRRGSDRTGSQLASIFMATTIAPAVATVVCMIFTWVRSMENQTFLCV